jgi:hypothetical protein
MRRLGLVVSAVCGAIAVGSAGVTLATPAVARTPAHAPVRAPAPSPSGPAAQGAGQPVCTVTSKDVLELSGLVATDTGYVAINDGNDNAPEKIFKLDNQCKLVSSVGYAPGDARDPEDLAVAPDGTIWVADVGDNDSKRTTVALWKVTGNKAPVAHRVTYPDGARDAEAMLLGADGVPIIITKETPGRPAGIYVPSAALVANSQNGVPLRRVGQITLPSSDTPNGIGPLGRMVVTGGAKSPDGKRVVLRTYADALEWDVPADGDVVKALTTGKPRITPLPNEPQGESITYSRDGKSFVTVSDLPQGRTTPLLRYTPASGAAPAAQQTAAGGDANNASAEGGGFFSDLTLDDITYLIASIGVLGLLLVLVGVFAIRKSRRDRRRAAAQGGRGGSGGPGRGPGGPGRDGPRGPGARGPGAGANVTGAMAVGAGATGRVSGSARRSMVDDDDGFGPPSGALPPVYGAAPAGPRGGPPGPPPPGPPPEPSTPSGGFRAVGGRENTGNVYGSSAARRIPDPDPYDYEEDRRRRGRR